LHEQLLQRFLLFACCLKAALRLARLVLTVRSDSDGDDSLSLFLLAAPTWPRIVPITLSRRTACR
jgi:hypothetical protein